MVNFYAICGSEILAGVFFRDRSEMRVRATLIDSVLLETKHIFSNFVQNLYEVINIYGLYFVGLFRQDCYGE